MAVWVIYVTYTHYVTVQGKEIQVRVTGVLRKCNYNRQINQKKYYYQFFYLKNHHIVNIYESDFIKL